MLTPLINSAGRQFGLSATIDNRPKQVRFDAARNRWVRENGAGYEESGGLDGAAGIPSPAPVDEVAQMENFYRQRAAGSFMQRLTGEVNVGNLETNQLANDPRWRKLYEQDPERANAIFNGTQGFSPQEAYMAKQFRPTAQMTMQAGNLPFGMQTPHIQDGAINAREIRLKVAQQAAAQKMTPDARLRLLEQTTGVNPSLLLQKYGGWKSPTDPGDAVGYDDPTQLLWELGDEVQDSQNPGKFFRKPSRSRFIPRGAVREAQEVFNSLYGGGMGPSGGGNSVEARRAEWEQLKQKNSGGSQMSPSSQAAADFNARRAAHHQQLASAGQAIPNLGVVGAPSLQQLIDTQYGDVNDLRQSGLAPGSFDYRNIQGLPLDPADPLPETWDPDTWNLRGTRLKYNSTREPGYISPGAM